MPAFLDGLEGAPRLLMQAPLKPVQGSRFQPTGFPDLGAAVYRTDSGEELLVESAQSMANRLEEAMWDPARQTVVAPLDGVSYIRVLQDGEFLTSSVTESHRINSPYILEGEDSGFLETLKEETNVLEQRPVDLRLLARIHMRYDCNCLLHGAFLAKKELAGGRLRLPRSGMWIDGPADQLVRELTRRGVGTPSTEPEPLGGTEAAGRPLRWLKFARHRRGGDYGPTSPRGYGFRVTFAEPVTGPVVAGYGAHFGLGQFVAVDGQ